MKERLIKKIAVMYLLLPFIIFVLGWMKPYLAVPVVILLLFVTFLVLKDKMEKENTVITLTKDSVVRLLFVVGCLALWVYFSGIGKFVAQNTDQPTRNGIFNMLVHQKWPVVGKAADGNTRALVYYIGFWLPSALVGKLFGLRAGYYAQAVWALVGVTLVYLMIAFRRGKIAVWPALVLMFFSSPDVIGAFLTGFDVKSTTIHLEWWSLPFEYSGMTTQLNWVFNQAVPIWVAILLVFTSRSNRNIVFILGLCMIHSTLPFIGLLPIAVYLMLRRTYGASGKKEHILCLCKDTFTLPNILGGGLAGILSFLYLTGNRSGHKIMAPDAAGHDAGPALVQYIVFLMIEVGFFVVLLYKYQKKNLLFYILTLWLIVCPLIRVGSSIDFCMRASIPALFVFMFYLMDNMELAFSHKEYLYLGGIILVLVLGSKTALNETTRAITDSYTKIAAEENLFPEDDHMDQILQSSNFSGKIDDSFFFKHLSKGNN